MPRSSPEGRHHAPSRRAHPPFAKSFSPHYIAVGGVTTLTFTIDNSANASAATGLTFTDTFPIPIVVAGTPNVVNGCGGTLTANPGAGTITFSGGTAGPGASCTVSVDVTSNTSGYPTNTTGDLTSSAGNSGTATDTLGVGETRSLTIVKNTVPNGPQDFLFQSDCDEFSPSFTLDDDLDGTNPNMLECTPASGTYFVTEVAVPGYATSIVCDDPASTTIVGLTVTVELDDGEFITCTYTNTALPAGMTFQKIASKSAITSDPPEAFSWIYILTNTGGLPLTGVNISDPDLDAGTGFIVLDPDPQMDSNCTASGQPGSLTCIFPDPLDPGGSISVQVGMRAVPGTPSGPVVSNTAFAGSNETGGGVVVLVAAGAVTAAQGGPIAALGNVVINNNPILTITKSFDSAVVSHLAAAPTPSARYTFTVTNTGGVDAHNVDVVDAVPAGLRAIFVSNNGTIGGCRSDGLGLQAPVATMTDTDVISCTYEVTIYNGAAVSDGDAFLNTACVTSTEDPVGMCASDTINAAVAHLNINKSSSATVDNLSGSFTITINNDGTATATNVSLDDVVSSDLVVTSTSTDPGGVLYGREL